MGDCWQNILRVVVFARPFSITLIFCDFFFFLNPGLQPFLKKLCSKIENWGTLFIFTALITYSLDSL